MIRQIVPAFRILLVMTVLTGVAYPLVVTGIAQTAFSGPADGSLVIVDGEVRGSELIAQQFTGEAWFHPRPSAGGWDGAASGGSNLGPINPDLSDLVADRLDTYRRDQGLPDDAPVPVDAVTASASGLDPHISVADATLQAQRVARERGMDVADVLALVEANTAPAQLGFLSIAAVNVLTLNLALEAR
jgi:K+-transporting ATPase ATPase C chain